MKLTHEMANALFEQLDIETKRWLVCIWGELNNAKEKHPKWPKDKIHAAAIVGEEADELLRAAIQAVYENAPFYNMHKEAIQTGAMALRFLLEVGELPEHKDKNQTANG